MCVECASQPLRAEMFSYATFAIGYIDEETVSISARSKSDIDVADILLNIEEAKGGGNPTSAGAKATGITPLEFESILIDKTTEYLQETHDKPYVLKKNKKY